jgi:hypothetical protein
MEANMNIRIACGALILGGLLAGSPTLSPAQTQDAAAPKGAAAAVSQSAPARAAKKATVNTNMTPTKHRHWRHRGGRHPHFGSRRVRSHIHTPQ